MKTTVEIPDEILRKAKMMAARRNSSLKQLIVSGLSSEVAVDYGGKQSIDLLATALGVGRNTRSIGRLTREELYDRLVLR